MIKSVEKVISYLQGSAVAVAELVWEWRLELHGQHLLWSQK